MQSKLTDACYGIQINNEIQLEILIQILKDKLNKDIMGPSTCHMWGNYSNSIIFEPIYENGRHKLILHSVLTSILDITFLTFVNNINEYI